MIEQDKLDEKIAVIETAISDLQEYAGDDICILSAIAMHPYDGAVGYLVHGNTETLKILCTKLLAVIEERLEQQREDEILEQRNKPQKIIKI